MSGRTGLARLARIAIAALLAAGGAACGSGSDRSAPEVAPLDFTLKDMNGHDVKFADLKGKPLVINFWATWCGPCQVETPELEAVWQKYKGQGLTILGLETLGQTDSRAVLTAWGRLTPPGASY